MDYKKKYEGLMKNIEHLHESVNPEWKRTIECYIPELKESEDETIRENLIRFFSDVKGFSTLEYNYGITNEDAVAWLEKQGEQKPSVNCLLSWSEIDEKMLQSLEGIVKDYWAKAEQEKNEIKIREASNVSYFLKTIQKSPLCWIKCSDELPDRDGTYLVVTDGSQNDVYDMAKYDSIDGWHKASEILYWMPIPQLNNKSIVEQKPAWSEEDKLKMDTLIHVITNQRGSAIFEGFLPEELVNWLKSIKERVQPQPNKDWSEEDEMMINDIIEVLDEEYVFDYQKIVNWLKSLKERYTWKPSDEQMATFWDAICNLNHDGYKWINNMKSLYLDLEKLRYA